MAQGNTGQGTSGTGADAAINRRTTGDVATTSFAQELLWLLDRAAPGLTAYNVPRAVRVRGALNEQALRGALDAVVSRHEVLRTSYRAGTEGAPQQVIHAHRPFDLPVDDLRSLPDNAREAEAQKLVMAEATRSFDLTSDLLLRARLIRLKDDEHILVLVSHHIVSDGWSKGILFRELSAGYEALAAGKPPALAPLPIQFADFSVWQRNAAKGPELGEHLAYWRERLAAPLPSLDLPTDFPRPIAQGFGGSRRDAVLSAKTVKQLRELGLDHGATLYMVLLAAYQTVLHRYSGQTDIITGSPMAGRSRAETEGLIGYFANTLAMRNDFSDDPTIETLLERIAENAVEAYEHEAVPFEELVLELRSAEETPSHAPLFRCVLTMEDTLPDELRLGDTKIEHQQLDVGQTKFDLTLLVGELPDGGLRLALGYRTDLFTGTTAERFLGHVRRVLETAITDSSTRVSEIDLLTDGEREQLSAWNNTTLDEGAPATLVSLIAKQEARVPQRVAVTGSDASLDYAALRSQSNQIARALQGAGVKPGDSVALLGDRSAAAIVGLVGILKAGAAYVPLSVDAPAARLAKQITESNSRVGIAVGGQEEKLASALRAAGVAEAGVIIAGDPQAPYLSLPEADIAVAVTPEAVAYILFTSGSTGVPKGVAVTHANAAHYARAVSRVLAGPSPSGNGDAFDALGDLTFGLASTLAADLGNTSLLVSLLSGGTLHVLPKQATTEPAAFAEYVKAHPLDILKLTPNHFLALAGRDLAATLPRRCLVLGGEALRLDVARALVAPGKCRIVNHYGPTETTVGVCTFEVTSDSIEAASAAGAQTVPIGRPLANTHAYVVDSRGNEQPVGIPGELWIGGAGVTRGYIGRDDLTAERFVLFRGERVYRTGDRVRRLPDGAIIFLGRTDDQVKVRGYRVELGEIEQVLRSHQGVENGVVVLSGSEGDQRLVAYAVAKKEGYAVSHSDRTTPEKLTEFLAAQLPEYMVPSSVVLLDALPLTANGKVDRAKLPAVEGSSPAREQVAPRTPSEEVVAKIWRDVLKRDVIGVNESFLELGGHSLLAIRVLGRISKELGVRLALRTLFETPTVEQIAGLIDRERAQKDEDAAMRAALAAVESMSDAEVSALLTSDEPPSTR